MTLRITGSCEVYSTIDMTCPLCQSVVPAKTQHKCRRREKHARERFKRGQRVQLVEWDPRDGRHRGAARTGVIVGFSRGEQPVMVRVIRDGSHSRECWHMSKWELVF